MNRAEQKVDGSFTTPASKVYDGTTAALVSSRCRSGFVRMMPSPPVT